jgi:hypothetical protein
MTAPSCRLGSKPCEMDSRPFLHTFERAKLGPELPEPSRILPHMFLMLHICNTRTSRPAICPSAQPLCAEPQRETKRRIGQIVFVIQILTLSCPKEAEYDLNLLLLKILLS